VDSGPSHFVRANGEVAPIPDLRALARNGMVRPVAHPLNLGPMCRLVFDGAILSD